MDSIRLRMEGHVFDEGLRVDSLIGYLENTQRLFDNTYLVTFGKTKMTAKDRHAFQLRTYDIKHGSLESELIPIIQAVQMTLPAIGVVSSKTIWDLTKSSWEFAKLLFEIHKYSEEKPDVIHNYENCTVIHGGVKHEYNGPVYQIAQGSLSQYQFFAKEVRAGRVSNISLGENLSDGGISIGEDDKNLFDFRSELDQEVFEINCELFDFNKRNNGGKLEVPEKEAIPAGNYPFTIVGAQDQVEYVYSLLKPGIRTRCMLEKQINPLGEDKIRRIHILGIVHDGQLGF